MMQEDQSDRLPVGSPRSKSTIFAKPTCRLCGSDVIPVEGIVAVPVGHGCVIEADGHPSFVCEAWLADGGEDHD
jgi:hypothetical protein